MNSEADIFISYRRLDSGYTVDRIHEQLERHLGAGRVFRDISSINPGDEFAIKIREQLTNCRLMIAVIGPSWCGPDPSNGTRRINNQDDFVRQEIAFGISREIPILPVLLDGASMPSASELPNNLAPLAGRQALEVSRRHFNTDMKTLVLRAIELLNSKATTEEVPSQRSEAGGRRHLIDMPSHFGGDQRLDRSALQGERVAVLVGTKVSSQVRTLSVKDQEVFRDVECGPELVLIPQGEFWMGSAPSEEGHRLNEEPQHLVKIENPFAVSRFCVTFNEWEAALALGGVDRRPNDCGWGSGTRPVVNVSWAMAVRYCGWLSSLTGMPYRLLTEREWEYVCRAGTTTPFWWGEAAGTSDANFDGVYPYGSGQAETCRGATLPVNHFLPNAFGLYQTSGNVWEWCQDQWSSDYRAESINISKDLSNGEPRVIRGGSWAELACNVRSAQRSWARSGYSSCEIGFRIARDLV